jgi:predicted dinucleotide-binding enzyme
MEAAAGTVGIVGFGRFGRSLGELMAESGIDVRAYDQHAPVPGQIATASLGALVCTSQVVVLAVPVPALEAVIGEASAILTGRHLVLDVASVKLKRASPAASGRSASSSAPTAVTPARPTPPRAFTRASAARSGCKRPRRMTARWPARTRWGS